MQQSQQFPVCSYCGHVYDPETLHHDTEAQDDHWPEVERLRQALEAVVEADPHRTAGRIARKALS